MTESPVYLDAAAVAALLQPAEAVAVLEQHLADGSIDPEKDSPRLFSPAPGGELLLMPASLMSDSLMSDSLKSDSVDGFCGVKIVTIAPDNPQAGWPKIQGVYVLFESAHLSPVAIMDAAELTLHRTPAVTSLAVRHLLAADPTGRDQVNRLVVIGTGPQAEHHIRYLAATAAPAEIVVLGRRPEAAQALAARCSDRGLDVRSGSPADLPGADVIVCVTSSPTPVLDDDLVGADAIVCAVGAHGLDRREVPPALVHRADVVVEGRGSAMRESGNLIPARSVEEWAQIELTNLAELVAGRFRRRAGHPAFYSGVGMAWQDIALAAQLYRRQSSKGTS